MSIDQDMPLASSSTPLIRQLPINLYTRSSTHSIPQSTYFIPSDWRRFQLSELINKVLKNDDLENGKRPVPFDFVVEGEVLRGSLDNWVKRNRGNDEETTINVEYIESLLPPSSVTSFPQDDWVSGLSLARSGYILLSSYLSHLKVLPFSTSISSSSSSLYTLPLPTSLGATCCTWLSPPSTISNILLAAGGVDRAVHIYSLPSLEPDIAVSDGNTAKELYTLHGHIGPISSIIANKAGNTLISGSWDGNINLYSIPNVEPTEHQIPAEPISYLPGQKKRRKVEGERGPIEGFNDGDAVGREGGWRRVPDGVMRGHKGRVGGLVWDKIEEGRIWSAGWDGSVRGWEIENGVGAVVKQGPADKSALCIDQFNASGTLVTGNMDRTICLWDTRDATSLISLTLQTSSPIPSIRTHPTSQFTLASASYSGIIQIWDIRSPKNALFSVSKAHSPAGGGDDGKRKVTKNGKVLGERLLAVDWDGEVLVGGGEDGEVGVWRARGE